MSVRRAGIWHIPLGSSKRFLLKHGSGYQVFDDRFEFLFNSYYDTVGRQFPRSKRGLISRPGIEETLAYRHHVDQAIDQRLSDSELTDHELEVLTIGINHEQQHQELMLTDIKHVLSCNPLEPIYCDNESEPHGENELSWIPIEEGLVRIGNDSVDFAFDNERPRHRFFLDAYEIANRCVSCGEYLKFMEDGGYERPELWLSLGWTAVSIVWVECTSVLVRARRPVVTVHAGWPQGDR